MPQAEFQNVASAGIIVLLIILLAMNAVAIFYVINSVKILIKLIGNSYSNSRG